MSLLDTKKQRAELVVLVLALGLCFALWPYATGLIGAPVLYVLFAPMHGWLARYIRPRAAAAVVILTAFLLIVLPGTWLIGMLVAQAQSVVSGLMRSTLLERLSTFRIGQIEVGPQLVSVGRDLLSWLGGNALGFVGTATRFTLNILFSFFGLYYLLLSPDGAWQTVEPYIPFSHRNIEILRDRFRSVTYATVIGSGLVAVILGVLVGLAFLILGLDDPVFWGVITAVFAILPVLGAGLVWGPAAVTLVLDQRIGAAIFLAALGLLVLPNVENFVRPVVFKRYSQIHPMITLVGAVIGVSYFGLLGLLVGPLALSYLFELIRMYREEYLPA